MTEVRYFVARISSQEGPLNLDQLRRGLQSGRFRGSDLCWVDGGDGQWLPVSERLGPEAMQSTTDASAEAAVEAEGSAEQVDVRTPARSASVEELEVADPPRMPPELAQRMTPDQWAMAQRAAVAWRRFLARSLDFGLFGVMVELAIGMDMNPPQVPSLGLSLLIFALVPWYEAVLISQFGNTPGKALLRLRIIARNNARPHFLQALTRGVWVWIRGLALGLPFLTQFAQIIAFNQYTRENRSDWDERAGTRILVLPISQLRMSLVLASIIGLAVASLLQRG